MVCAGVCVWVCVRYRVEFLSLWGLFLGLERQRIVSPNCTAAWGQGVQSLPVPRTPTRWMSWDAYACLWFEGMFACMRMYVHRYLWRDTEGVQSGISFAVMTHSGGIPQPPRQNSPSCSGHKTQRLHICVSVVVGCVCTPTSVYSSLDCLTAPLWNG